MTELEIVSRNHPLPDDAPTLPLRVASIAGRLRAKYGRLLDRPQLAQAIGRPIGGVRTILASPRRRKAVPQLAWLHSKRWRIGRRDYFLFSDVAKAIYYGDTVVEVEDGGFLRKGSFRK